MNHYVITLALWDKYDMDVHYSKFTVWILANTLKTLKNDKRSAINK